MITTWRGLPLRAGQMGFVWAREALARKPGIYHPHGIPVRADARADFALRYRLATGRGHEAPMVQLVTRHLQVDTDVIELGACIGVLSASIRAQIGAHASHVVVEPDPDLAALALENAQGPMPERTELVRAAVDYSGDPRIRCVPARAGQNSHVALPGEAGFVVNSVTLSGLAEKLSDRFALVCDIGGAELSMLEAEINKPALARCDLLVLEVHPSRSRGGETAMFQISEQLADIGLKRVERIDRAIAYARGASS